MDLNTLKLNDSAIFESETFYIYFIKILTVNENLTKVFAFKVITESKKNHKIGLFGNIDPKNINEHTKIFMGNKLKFVKVISK